MYCEITIRTEHSLDFFEAIKRILRHTPWNSGCQYLIGYGLFEGIEELSAEITRSEHHDPQVSLWTAVSIAKSIAIENNQAVVLVELRADNGDVWRESVTAQTELFTVTTTYPKIKTGVEL